MFYQADEIGALLICSVCKQKILDPCLLPCGKSYFLTDKEEKSIECQNCSKTHGISNGGYNKILVSQEIHEFKDKEFLQPTQIEEFKTVLESLESIKLKIGLILNAGGAKIRDFYDKITNSMQMAKEEAKSKLDEIHKEFLEEICQQERTCQRKLKYIQQNTKEIETTLSISNEFIKKSNQILNKYQIDDSELRAMLDQAHIILDNLEVTNDKLERDMFNEVILKFEKKLFDPSSIGTLIKENIELYFLDNIGNMREINLISNIDCTRYWPCLRSFKSKSFQFLYEKNNGLCLICIDKNGKSLFEKTNLIQSKNVEKFIAGDFFITSNKKIIFICTREKHFDQENPIVSIRSFDETFNLLAEITLARQPVAFGLNGENLFLLNKNDFSSISMYSSNLDIVQVFGQADRLQPFFFSPEIQGFMVSDEFFILYEVIEDENGSNLIVLNRATGLVETNFIVSEYFTIFQLYLNKFILAFNQEKCLLRSFNLSGDLIRDVALDEKFKDANFFTANKEVCFITDKDYLYIF